MGGGGKKRDRGALSTEQWVCVVQYRCVIRLTTVELLEYMIEEFSRSREEAERQPVGLAVAGATTIVSSRPTGKGY